MHAFFIPKAHAHIDSMHLSFWGWLKRIFCSSLSLINIYVTNGACFHICKTFNDHLALVLLPIDNGNQLQLNSFFIKVIWLSDSAMQNLLCYV